MAAMDRLNPPIRVGERVTLRLVDPARDLIGFVVALDPLTLEDRHGRAHVVAAGTVQAARRVGVSLGRDPRSAPRDLLDALAVRAGVDGEPELFRISDLLAGRPVPAAVFAGRGEWSEGEWRARVEGEWLTTNVTDPALLIELAWWATRQNARSVQVRR
ncbi:MAG: hypothetical protein QM619_04670 [Micropruina sp.]|uniref:hypothetical protein n=1 Tax=Micropruina sp. TaxID=2737536 RepID=UPI0039E5C5B2